MKNQKLRPKNWNEHVVKPLIILLFIAAAVALIVLTGCQKEHSFTRPARVIESDHHLTPREGYSLQKRDVTPELWQAAKKTNPGKGKGGGKPTTPVDTTTPDEPNNPPPTAQSVILLDFDGQNVVHPYWNGGAPINAAYSGMNATEIAATVQRVREDYSPFAVTVTTDETVYNAAPTNKRVRVIITESWEWYGQAGGVAYLGSFSWGNETPAWVFSSLLGYSAKYVADAAAHEGGHTLGLRHQSRWEGGVKVEEYNSTLAPDGKGYLMGLPYYHLSGWQTGLNSYGTTQDDRAIISSTLKQ